MTWEDLEDEERELLREARYSERKRYYGAMTSGLMYYIIGLVIALVFILLGLWIGLT